VILFPPPLPPPSTCQTRYTKSATFFRPKNRKKFKKMLTKMAAFDTYIMSGAGDLFDLEAPALRGR